MFENASLNDWFAKGERRHLNGYRIFCIDELAASDKYQDNDKEVLLLIHGFPTASFDFHKMWPALSERFRLISLDMLGFGFSDKPDRRRYTLHAQADLFESFLRQAGVQRCHVLAHDYGVSIAQELIARQSDPYPSFEITSCCFLNGGLFPETHRALLTQKLLLSSFGKWITRFYSSKDRFAGSFSSVFGADSQPSEQELSEFWELINYREGRHLFHNLITYMEDRIEHRSRWLHALQNASMPLSLINGSVDPVSGAHLVARYKELNCRLDHVCELETIGHYPHTESPQAVTQAYLSFLGSS